MAQTKRKRRRKHRGTQAGTVERARGGSHRAGASKAAKPTARELRAERMDRPPTWRGALNRAAISALVLAVVSVLLLHFAPARAAVVAAAMMVLYVPMSYYTDGLMYRRRQRRKAASGGRSVRH